jgi:hypothetical protein
MAKSESYAMSKNKDGHIGYALIINNVSFQDDGSGSGKPKPKRLGSDLDVKQITQSMERLGFRVTEAEVDLRASELRRLVNHVLKYVDFTEFACFACVLMSHGGGGGGGGGNDQVLCVDNECVDLHEEIVRACRAGVQHARWQAKTVLCAGL